MKKIILLLFLFLTMFSCYLIYNFTNEEKIYCLTIGDNIADNPYLKNNSKITEYNNYYINKDYRIIALLNIVKYNEEIEINNKKISIHQLLKKADIIILSVGMNDIYYKLNDSTKDVYTYMNDMVNNMEELLKFINRYYHKQVIVLGYYNISNKNNDIFTYLNYKMEKITEKENFTYINLNQYLKNSPKYLEKVDNFYLNNQGYTEINKLIVEKLKIS